MKFVNSNGYVIAEIAGNLFVVDTGSPMSFNFKGLSRLTINGENYDISSKFAVLKEEADSITGVDLAGFIGTDILQKTNLTIDYENNELFFGIKENVEPRPDLYFMPFELRSVIGQQYVATDDISINGTSLKSAVIDTGAPISYVSENVAGSLETTGEYYADRSPMLGDLNGEYRKGGMRFNSMPVGSYNIPVKVGVISGPLDGLGSDAVIGSGSLSKKLVFFDFVNKRIGIALDERSKSFRE